NFIFSELTERRPRFPLPLRPSSAAVAATTATSCSSLITFDLEKALRPRLQQRWHGLQSPQPPHLPDLRPQARPRRQ
ncbi:hypothetical protein LINPERHAP1_LOCUS36424, partial [Linum perenne]